MLDCSTTSFKYFNWKRYSEIVKHKTSYYTYYLPLSMGFALADFSLGLSDLKLLAFKLGYLFQAQVKH